MKKILLLVVTMANVILLQAQENDGFKFSFNHLALSVKDVNRSAAFYTEIFKLKEITNRTAMDGIRWISLGEGKELHLIAILKEAVKVNKAVHFALSTAHFDSFIKVLNEKKIVFSDWPGNVNTINKRADGILQIYLQDPDGYWIEVNSVVN
ncbi:MAG TPA: VOC family protein [Ferruginibacter sp.]|nr:VOC family protein [Ferruginibacter sp.]